VKHLKKGKGAQLPLKGWICCASVLTFFNLKLLKVKIKTCLKTIALKTSTAAVCKGLCGCDLCAYKLDVLHTAYACNK
jgi:hypothetical protein